jgi:hypothetical protein
VRPQSASCAICQCRWGESDCFHFDGIGTADDPLVLQATFNEEDAGQLLECGPAGLAAFLPPYLLDPPCVNTYTTISQTIPYDVAQILFFNEDRYDTDSMHETDGVTSRLTFKTAGVYLVTLNVRWKKVTVDSGDVAVFIRQNGADFLGIDSMPIADPDLFCSHSLSVEANFDAGDYVEAMAKQDAVRDNEGRAMTILTDYQLPSFAAAFMRPSP